MNTNTLFRWFLALLCFGMLGNKIASAQCSLPSSYGGNFSTLLRHNYQTDVFAFADADGQNWLNAYNNGGTATGAHNWSNTDGTYWAIPTSADGDAPFIASTPALSTKAGTNGIAFHIINSDGAGAADSYFMSIDEIAVIGANNNFTVAVNGTTVSDPSNVGVTVNGIDWDSNTITINPFTTTKGAVPFTFDNLQVAYTIYDENKHVVCSVAIPEPSSALLVALGSAGLLMRRRA